MFEVQNPVRVDARRIDCELRHPTLGWIPFTASLDDTEAHGRVIYEHIVAEASAGRMVITGE